MHKKAIFLVFMIFSKNILAELPHTLSVEQMSSIIRGDGKLSAGQKHCKLDKNYIEIREATDEEIGAASEESVVALLNRNPEYINKVNETAHRVEYIMFSDIPGTRAFLIALNC